jgi:hypothetical protein
MARRLGGRLAPDEKPTWMADGAVYRFGRRAA